MWLASTVLGAARGLAGTLLCSQLRWRDRLGSSSSGECRKGTSSMALAWPCEAMPQERTMWLAQAASCGWRGLGSQHSVKA